MSPTIIQEKIDQQRLNQTSSEQGWLSDLCLQLEAAQAALYMAEDTSLELKHSFAMIRNPAIPVRFSFGEGMVGRVAAERIILRIDSLPDGYINVVSGLGQASPKHLILFPIQHGNICKGVLEIASFVAFQPSVAVEIETAISAFANNITHN